MKRIFILIFFCITLCWCKSLNNEEPSTESSKIITSSAASELSSTSSKLISHHNSTTLDTKKSPPTATTKKKKKLKSTTNFPKIVDRNIFNAPEKCFDGFGFVGGRCRRIYDSFDS